MNQNFRENQKNIHRKKLAPAAVTVVVVTGAFESSELRKMRGRREGALSAFVVGVACLATKEA